MYMYMYMYMCMWCESLRPRAALLALNNAFLALTPWGGKANLAHAGAAGTELPVDPHTRSAWVGRSRADLVLKR